MAAIIFLVIINCGTLNWIAGASQTAIELTKEMVGKIETPWIIYFNLILILIGILQQTKRKNLSELQREKLKRQELKSFLGVYTRENSMKLNNLNIYSQDSKSGTLYIKQSQGSSTCWNRSKQSFKNAKPVKYNWHRLVGSFLILIGGTFLLTMYYSYQNQRSCNNMDRIRIEGGEAAFFDTMVNTLANFTNQNSSPFLLLLSGSSNVQPEMRHNI